MVCDIDCGSVDLSNFFLLLFAGFVSMVLAQCGSAL